MVVGEVTHNIIKINKLKGLIVPSCIEHLTEIKTNAKFVLIVEKDATFQRLLDDKFLTIYSNSILITGKGIIN